MRKTVRLVVALAVILICTSAVQSASASNPQVGFVLGVTPNPNNGIAVGGTNWLPNGEAVTVTLILQTGTGMCNDGEETIATFGSNQTNSFTWFNPGDVVSSFNTTSCVFEGAPILCAQGELCDSSQCVFSSWVNVTGC